jgi:hypothetical protein
MSFLRSFILHPWCRQWNWRCGRWFGGRFAWIDCTKMLLLAWIVVRVKWGVKGILAVVSLWFESGYWRRYGYMNDLWTIHTTTVLSIVATFDLYRDLEALNEGYYGVEWGYGSLISDSRTSRWVERYEHYFVVATNTPGRMQLLGWWWWRWFHCDKFYNQPNLSFLV